MGAIRVNERTPGVYHLLVHVDQPVSVRIGRLGTFAFPAGWYVYTGSAMGGLEARIARHHRRRKRLHWHIDYLLTEARLMDIATTPTTKPIECMRNREVLALPGASVIVPRFGASDCRCRSHLVCFGAVRPELTS
jgi:sugar fermentation stimulation protein A